MKKFYLILLTLPLLLFATTNSIGQTWTVYDGAKQLTDAANSSGITWVEGDLSGTNTATAINVDARGNSSLAMVASLANRSSFKTPNVTDATFLPENATLIFRAKSNNTGTTATDFGFMIEFYSKGAVGAAKRFDFRIQGDGTLRLSASSSTFSLPTVTQYHTYRMTVETGSIYKVYVDENPTPIYNATSLTSTSGNKYCFRTGNYQTSGTFSTSSELDWMAWDLTGAYPPAGTAGADIPLGYIVDGGSSINTLSDLKVGGTSVTSFAPTTLAYNITLPSGTTAVPATTYTATDPKALVVVTEAADLSGTTTVKVYAQNGTLNTYTITYTVFSLSNNANLSDIKVGGTTVPGFAESTLTYNVVLPSGTTVLPDITWTKADANSNVVYTAATSVTGSATIVVTAQDGVATKTYTINFSVALSNNPNLSDIKVGGTSIAGFTAGTITYNVALPYGTTVVPDVTWTLADANSTVVYTAATSVTGSATITVTAADGITTKTYTINFSVALSNIADLSDIKVNGTSITGFAANTTTYSVVLPYGTTTVPTVTYTITDANATAVYTPSATVAGSATIVVTAQDGVATKTYTLNFSVALSNDANLTNIKVNGTSVTGFSSGTLSYNVELPTGTTVIPTVTYTKSDANATIVYTPAASVTGTATIAVTAPDGVAKKTYTISFSVALPSNNDLLDLKVNGKSITGFSPSVTTYNINVSLGYPTLPVFTWTLSDPLSTAVYTYTPGAAYQAVATIKVTGQNGVAKTYTINITFVTGIENLVDNNFIIHQNPVIDVLKISINEKYIGADVDIFSINGQQVFKGNCYENTLNIQTSSFQKGTYIIRFSKSGLGSVSGKFVK